MTGAGRRADPSPAAACHRSRKRNSNPEQRDGGCWCGRLWNRGKTDPLRSRPYSWRFCTAHYWTRCRRSHQARACSLSHGLSSPILSRLLASSAAPRGRSSGCFPRQASTTSSRPSGTSSSEQEERDQRARRAPRRVPRLEPGPWPASRAAGPSGSARPSPPPAGVSCEGRSRVSWPRSLTSASPAPSPPHAARKRRTPPWPPDPDRRGPAVRLPTDSGDTS